MERMTYDRAPVLVRQPSPVMWGRPWNMAWLGASDIALIKTFQKHSHVKSKDTHWAGDGINIALPT